jgi:DNA-binding LytR/AlgR family response regulator
MKKVFVVEDMALNRISLENMLVRGGYKIIGSVATAEKAWEQLQQCDADIVLIDINLAGEKDGIWLAEQIKSTMNSAFMFLTAFGDDITLERVMNTSPNGYLMKPYNFPSLMTNLQIALANNNEKYHLKKALKKLNHSEQTITVKVGTAYIKLNTNDILYVMSEGNYLEIIFKNTKHIIREKLSVFIEQLPKEQFIQIHQRYIANIKHIQKINKNSIEINDDVISVSKTYKVALKSLLNLN